MPSASPPRFFLESPPDGGPPRLLESELLHALQVLRMRPGDPCVGLDGRGRAWPLRVAAAGRRELGLEVTGPVETEPEPGAADAPLPWIEVAVAWPRKNRAEEMLGRLVQLGAAAVTPLVARQSGPQPAPDPSEARWGRILREACKQCRRHWLPVLNDPLGPLELLLARPGSAVALLEPSVGMSLDTWARSLKPSPEGLGTRAHPIVLAVGPEGGFSEEEREGFHLKGATSVRVGPHVLRIETAAEAALAVVGTVWS